MLLIQCLCCGEAVQAQRKTRKFCSTRCASRHARGWPTKRSCRHCGAEFEVRERSDANRRHCSKQCAKNAHTKNIRGWLDEHPEAMERYNANRVRKNPRVWTDKWKRERLGVIKLLGGACVVCGVTNPHWLHVDFIPTTVGMRHRHPRHLAYIREHKHEFRLLCANHHYELTLTGRIEGTGITQ